jgi:hypothetical protein
MKTEVNIARITLAVLCIMGGIVFGGLGFLLPAPTSQTAHGAVPAHVQISTHADMG